MGMQSADSSVYSVAPVPAVAYIVAELTTLLGIGWDRAKA
jgi:hypothetical protein